MKKYISVMIALALLEIGLALYLAEWRRLFWDYVVAKDYIHFMQYLGIFTVVACTLCVIAAWTGYLANLTTIKWREKLNKKALTRYGVDYALGVENANQRIQQDCSDYPQLMIALIFGFFKALFYILVFSILLIVEFSVYYLLIITAFAVISTLIAKKIAMPLISLNYKSQQVEATYRNNLLEGNFIKCIDVMLALARRTKKLQYFQVLYGQLGVIIPIVIIAPAYFSSALTVGALMMATSLMATISDNLSFGINSFNDINRLLSCRKRLKELEVL